MKKFNSKKEAKASFRKHPIRDFFCVDVLTFKVRIGHSPIWEFPRKYCKNCILIIKEV